MPVSSRSNPFCRASRGSALVIHQIATASVATINIQSFQRRRIPRLLLLHVETCWSSGDGLAQSFSLQSCNVWRTRCYRTDKRIALHTEDIESPTVRKQQ